MLRGYPLLCQRCGETATLKIASEWSDGQTRELKTYSICCEICLPNEWAASVVRQKNCRITLGEKLGPPGVYKEHRPLDRGRMWVLRTTTAVVPNGVVPLVGTESGKV